MVAAHGPLTIGPRDLVLLAGLPGAGKSTLLAGLDGGAGCTVCDSAQVRVWLHRRLPRWLPYRVYRPAVHLIHYVRVGLAALRTPGPLLVHDPATREVTRRALVRLAALTSRPAVLVWLDATPEQALEGQRARGRPLPSASFARHVARASRLRRLLREGGVPSGWARVVVLDRDEERMSLSVAVRGTAGAGSAVTPTRKW